MATTLIKFKGKDVKELQDRRLLLKVLFGDENRREYTWVPKWDDLHKLYIDAARIERLNGGKNPGGFVQVAKTIFSEEEVDDAHIVSGRLERVEKGKLVLSCWVDGGEARVEEAFPVAFQLDQDWLRDNLERWTRCLVIDGRICDVEVEGPPCEY